MSDEMDKMHDYRYDRGRNYRYDYRDDYMTDYRRGDGRRNNRMYRTGYGRNYRSNDEYTMMLEEIVDDGMELSRSYEDASEMAMNNSEKQKLMKMAEREKEHTKYVKEMIQNNM